MTRKTVVVKVTPNASRNRVNYDTLTDVYKLTVTATPENNKANKAVLKLLASELGVAPSKLSIILGAKGRDKIITVSD